VSDFFQERPDDGTNMMVARGSDFGSFSIGGRAGHGGLPNNYRQGPMSKFRVRKIGNSSCSDNDEAGSDW